MHMKDYLIMYHVIERAKPLRHSRLELVYSPYEKCVDSRIMSNPVQILYLQYKCIMYYISAYFVRPSANLAVLY